MITVVGISKIQGKLPLHQTQAIALANKGREPALLNGDLQRTARKTSCGTRSCRTFTSNNLVEKFDNLTQTLQALNEKFDDVIVDVAGRNSKEFITRELSHIK